MSSPFPVKLAWKGNCAKAPITVWVQDIPRIGERVIMPDYSDGKVVNVVRDYSSIPQEVRVYLE